jgi:hypothetical protein
MRKAKRSLSIYSKPLYLTAAEVVASSADVVHFRTKSEEKESAEVMFCIYWVMGRSAKAGVCENYTV